MVHTVLLYGSDRWVVTGEMLKVLEGFHHQVVRQVTGKTDWRTLDGEWEWPPVAGATEIASLWTIKDYFQWQQDNITDHIAFRPIY